MAIDNQVELHALMRQVLGENFTHLIVSRVRVEEDIEGGQTSVDCEVTDEQTGAKSIIAGRGVGMVDAFFQGMIARFAEEYPSLRTIRFHSFCVNARLDTKKAFSGTDSEGEVVLEVANSEDRVFTFRSSSRSVIKGAIVATLLALEHFINGERAFLSLFHAVDDAKRRNRQDLVQRFTNDMAVLVRNTSYSEVIAKAREAIEKH